MEKAPELGAHTLSGAVIETKSLDILLPNWKELDSPIKQQVNVRRMFEYEAIFWF